MLLKGDQTFLDRIRLKRKMLTLVAVGKAPLCAIPARSFLQVVSEGEKFKEKVIRWSPLREQRMDKKLIQTIELDKKLRPIKQRVIDFIENQSIKKEIFYKKTLLASSNFKGEGLKSELGGENIAKILIAYPQINARWLLTGEGEMLGAEQARVAPDKALSEMKDKVAELQDKLIRCYEENSFLNKAQRITPTTIPEPELKPAQ